MRRGDIVAVVLARDYGKPRPALVVQSDLYGDLDSIVVCPVTSELRTYSHFRIGVAPSPENGLRIPSQVMIDKVSAIPKERAGARIGQVGDDVMGTVSAALAVFLGLA